MLFVIEGARCFCRLDMTDDESLVDEITRLALVARLLRPQSLSLSSESKVLANKYPHRAQADIAEMIRARFRELDVALRD